MREAERERQKETERQRQRETNDYGLSSKAVWLRIHVGMDEMYEKFKNLLMLL